MAYNALNNLIDAYIYPNGVQAITGSILNNVLKAMVSQLGGGYNLMGVAAPASSPAVNDEPLAYFAATAGTYTNFDGIVLAAGEVAVLLTSGNGSWSKQTIYNVPTGTADLANTAGFITSAVNSLVNYYTKTEIDTALAGYTTTAALASALADYYNKAAIDAQMATRYTKSEVDTKLGDYYRKTETYDKDEVDSIIAALSRQEYIVAWDGLAAPDVSAIPAGVTVTYSGTTYTGTLAASASTVNKIYMVWNGTAYDMYGTSADGGYSWVPMGTTTVDLSQYVTKEEFNQLKHSLVGANITQNENPGTVNSIWIDNGGVIGTGPSGAGMYRAEKVAVTAGMKVSLSTTGASYGSTPAAFFCDDSGNIIQTIARAGTTTTFSGECPSGATYIYVNYMTTYALSLEGIISEISEQLDTLGNNVSENEKDIETLSTYISKDYSDQPKTLASRWINDDGVVSYDSSVMYARYEPIPVREGEEITYTAGAESGGNILFMIADSSGNILLSRTSENGTITAPANSAYVYINSDPPVYSCVVKSKRDVEVDAELDELENDITKYAAIGAGAEASIPMVESDFESGDINWRDGSPETSSIVIRGINQILVFGGAKITYHTDNGYRVKFAFYRDNGTFLEVRQWFSGDGFLYMPLSAQKMRVLLASPSGASYSPVWADAGLTISVNPSAEYKRAADNEKLYLPIYPPSPQLPANGSEGSDFNAETLTPAELNAAFASLLAAYPTPSESNYIQPKYGLRSSIIGRDATNTFDIYAYQFGKKNRYAWKAANPLFAWKNGGTIIYTDSISPRIGDAVYTSSARAISGATVSSFNSTNQQVVVSGTTYDRANDSNVATDVLYSQTPQRTSAGNRDLYDRNDALVGTGTAIGTSNLSYNGKTYSRCEELDYHTDQKMTVVLWGNEHGPQSDPAEPAIILYRLAKYLLGTCRNNDFISFLKNYCNVVLIPCANPYGLQNHTRTNGNGVNINRNYCTPGWASQADADKGSYAGDQPETQFVMNTVAYFGANVAIDIHCLGYVNADSQGKTHYEGFIPSEDINRGIYEIMRSLSHTYTNYGDAAPLTHAQGSDWLNYIGVSGGLIEMNAGFAEGNGPQHTAEIMELDFTLLLNTLRLWIFGYNQLIDFSKVAIR